VPEPEVRLRRWRASDALQIAAMTAEEHIRRWSSMGDDVSGWVQRQRAESRGPSRAICLGDDDRPLGKIALRLPEHASPATSCAAIGAVDAPVGELSYWLVPAARGRGLAGAAVRAMIRLAAETTTLRTVVLDIEPENAASVRLAQRLGAERRSPERTEADRYGVPRTLAVFVMRVPRP
jgi:ribosomal-protein-alanine N-acetyltransferase